MNLVMVICLWCQRHESGMDMQRRISQNWHYLSCATKGSCWRSLRKAPSCTCDQRQGATTPMVIETTPNKVRDFLVSKQIDTATVTTLLVILGRDVEATQHACKQD